MRGLAEADNVVAVADLTRWWLPLRPRRTACRYQAGRGPGDYLLDSYRCLFMEYRRARGLPDTDMLFDGV